MRLHVIHAVRQVAARKQETRATVAHRLHDGQVQLGGDRARATRDQPSTRHPADRRSEPFVMCQAGEAGADERR
jgi:hypothetical protein